MGAGYVLRAGKGREEAIEAPRWVRVPRNAPASSLPLLPDPLARRPQSKRSGTRSRPRNSKPKGKVKPKPQPTAKSETHDRLPEGSQETSADGSSADSPIPEIINAEGIDPRKLDKDALHVVQTLQRRGYEAYFVGGCVRDLLIGKEPKDYDVATSARPGQAKRQFRNGRIIGRRFRLVHVRYGPHKIIETATFRREPEQRSASKDLLITEDNEYGTAAEDAQRRDFTVNALFLEPRKHQIIDYVHGLEDLEDRILRTIGDPEVRLREDPVRILRAVKFATRLDFRIEDATWDAMCSVAPELDRSAAPRIFEEIIRLMRSGTALGSLKMLRACGALRVILPAVDEHLGPRRGGPEEGHLRAELFWRMLEALDAEVHGGYEPSISVVLSVLFNELVERQMDTNTRTLPGAPSDRLTECRKVMDSITEAARLNRREFSRAQRLIAAQDSLAHLTRPRFSPLLFARGEGFEDAHNLFGLRAQARGVGWDIFEAWEEIHERSTLLTEEEIQNERKRVRRRPRRRRKR